MLGFILYEIIEVLFYSGKLLGTGIYSIYTMIYGTAPDPNNEEDVERIKALEERIKLLEAKLNDTS